MGSLNNGSPIVQSSGNFAVRHTGSAIEITSYLRHALAALPQERYRLTIDDPGSVPVESGSSGPTEVAFPASLEGNLLVWLDPSYDSGVTLSGASGISTIEDRTGTYTFTATGDSVNLFQDAFTIDGLTRNLAVIGDGAGLDYLQTTGFNMPAQCTIVCIFSHTSGGTEYIYSIGSSLEVNLNYTPGSNAFQWAKTDSGLLQYNGSAVSLGYLVDMHVSIITYDAGTPGGTVDGNTGTVLDIGAGTGGLTNETINFGELGGSTTNLAIGEFMVFDKVLSAGEISTLQAYIDEKWPNYNN